MQVRDSVDAWARAAVPAHFTSVSTWCVPVCTPRTQVYTEQVSVGCACKRLWDWIAESSSGDTPHLVPISEVEKMNSKKLNITQRHPG